MGGPGVNEYKKGGKKKDIINTEQKTLTPTHLNTGKAQVSQEKKIATKRNCYNHISYTGNAISQPEFCYGFWGTAFYVINLHGLLVYTIYSVRTGLKVFLSYTALKRGITKLII